MSSIPCNIVALPSDDLAQRATQLSIDLSQHGVHFTLKDGSFYPHASLYMTQLKIADLGKVEALLADIADKTPKLDLSAMNYSQTMGYVDAEYARTAALDNLQAAVLEAINPIRDGMHEKDKPRMEAATGKKREYFKLYGYPNVGELFRPHLTLTRFTNEEPIDAGDLPEIRNFSGTSLKLGLFEMGDNGTCVRKIAECNFGGTNK